MRVLGSLISFLLLVATATAQYQPVRIPNDSKFTQNVVFEESRGEAEDVISSGTKNGIRYKLFHRNASGFVQGSKGQNLPIRPSEYGSDFWHLRCDRYPEADSRKCGIFRYGIAFIINIGKSGSIPWLTTVSGHLGLSAPSLIEVDGVIVYQENKMATDAMEWLSQGKKATVRIAPNADFPEWRVISFDLYGFNEAVDLCSWAVKEIQ